MQIRGSTLAVLVLLLPFSIAAPRALAQVGADAADSASGAGADEVEVLEEEPAEYSDALPPGMEERIIMAGESESAAAFAAGDSVTGFSAADMEALGALSIADLSAFTPNLEIVTSGATTPTFFIRGVGLNDFASNAAGSVAIYQDQVAINAPALQLSTLFDMENVLIERGPVGTGPFRNASAGAIKLYSRKPTGTYNGFLRSSFGRFNYRDFEGAVEAPIFEDILSTRVAFRASMADGWMQNACGNPIPIALRTGRTPPANQPADDPRWSLCGEGVPYNPRQGAPFFEPPFVSPLEEGLPDRTNNLNNWAARATMRFTPTLDQEWLLNGHLARRDEFTRQGLSYGTTGTQQYLDSADPTRPDQGSRIDGLLGSDDGGGFTRQDVLEQVSLLRALYLPEVQARCAPNCTNTQLQEAIFRAQIDTANDIGPNLSTDPFVGYYNTIGKTTNLTYGAFLSGDIALPNDLTLRTVTGYDRYDRFIENDLDQSPNVLFEITTDDEGWQFFQDVGIGGPIEDFPGDWDIGAFYLQEELSVAIQNDFGELTAANVAARDYVQKTWSFGVYSSFDWDFWDDFTLDGGVRYNWERKDIDYELQRGNSVLDFQSRTRSAPTGGIRLTYSFREDTHAYWKYTRGWKGGHFNATSSLTDGVSYAEPETNNAYEAGFRASFFDSRLGLNLSLFFYDYTNYQLFTVDNNFGSNPEFIIINADAVNVFGSEVELQGQPWDGAFAHVRFGWLESTFADFVQVQTVREDVPGSSVQIVRDIEINYTGNRLLNSPRFTISMTFEQTLQLGRYGSITGRFDTRWSDTTYFDPTEGRGQPNSSGQLILPNDTIGQKPYWLHNLLVTYRPPIGNIAVEFYVRNLADEVYRNFAFDASQFQSTTIHFVGEPRTFGVTFAIDFN